MLKGETLKPIACINAAGYNLCTAHLLYQQPRPFFSVLNRIALNHSCYEHHLCNKHSLSRDFWCHRWTVTFKAICDGLVNERQREREGVLNVLAWVKLLSYSPRAHFQDSFWSPTNKPELFISACQPKIYSDCSGYRLTLPIDSSTYFLIGFLTASQNPWLIALTSCLELHWGCVCPDKEGHFKKARRLLEVTFVHSGGGSILQHAAR